MVRLEQIVDMIKDIVRICQNETRGRPAEPKPGAPSTYARPDIVLIFLLKTLKGWSVNHTHKKLVDDIDSTWRDLLGLTTDELPSRRWLNDLKDHADVKRWRRRIFRRLGRRLLQDVDLETLAVDLTPIEVNLEWDHLASWGYTSDEEAFYGYKLHLLCTADGLPLALRVTRADGHELNEVIPLFKEAERLLGQEAARVAHILGDAAYDANDVYEGANEHLDAQFQADANRRNADVSDEAIQEMTRETAQQLATHPERQQGLLTRYSEEGKERHEQRTTIEEIFGICKDLMPNFTDLKWYQAGIRQVREHFRWTLFAFVTILARNKEHDESFLGIKMVVS